MVYIHIGIPLNLLSLNSNSWFREWYNFALPENPQSRQGDWLSSVSRDPHPVIHPCPVAIHIWPWSISGQDPSPVIHLLSPSAVIYPKLWCIALWSLWLQLFISTRCVIALVLAAFRHFPSSSVRILMVIFTNLHHVRLLLTLHRSPIIHLVTYCWSYENTPSLIRPYGMGSISPNPWSGRVITWS